MESGSAVELEREDGVLQKVAKLSTPEKGVGALGCRPLFLCAESLVVVGAGGFGFWSFEFHQIVVDK
jgi:hypothetical protein